MGVMRRRSPFQTTVVYGTEKMDVVCWRVLVCGVVLCVVSAVVVNGVADQE